MTRKRRGRPPRPLVGLVPIARLLNRHTVMDCGEARLVVAVIVRAIGDCLDARNASQRRQARRFLLGPALKRGAISSGSRPISCASSPGKPVIS